MTDAVPSAPAVSRRAAIAFGAGVGPLALGLYRLHFGLPIVAEVVVAVLLIGGALVHGRRLIALGLLVLHLGAARIGSPDPDLVSFLSVAVPLAAAIATGAVPIDIARPRPSPARPVGLVAVPVLLADAVLLVRPSIAYTAILISPTLWIVLFAHVLPGAWRAVERWTGPLTRVLVAGARRSDNGLVAGFGLLGRAITPTAMALGWGLVVLVPWAAQRGVRNDPLDAPRSGGSGWVRRERTPLLRTTDLWFPDPAARRDRRRRGLRAAAHWAVLLAVVGGLWAIPRVRHSVIGRIETQLTLWRQDEAASTGTAPAPQQRIAAAEKLVAEPWFDSYERTYDVMLRDAEVTQYSGTTLANARSRFLTYQDGIRRSWRPPEGRCPEPIRIWMYGGSTVFGLGQRDMYTLPSELARRAWRDGVALEIENHGVPGDVSWIQQRRLELDLARREDRPDLVLFYDGYNDLRSVEWVSMTGTDVRGQYWGLNDRDLFPLFTRFVRIEEDGRAKMVADAIDIAADPQGDDAAIVDGAVRQYRDATALTRRILEDAQLPFAHFFQPWVATRTPEVAGDFPASPVGRDRARRMRAQLPPGTIDLAGALDASRQPYFTDDIHTNEAANRPIAVEMWREIRTQLEASPAAGKVTSCS